MHEVTHTAGSVLKPCCDLRRLARYLLSVQPARNNAAVLDSVISADQSAKRSRTCIRSLPTASCLELLAYLAPIRLYSQRWRCSSASGSSLIEICLCLALESQER